MTQALCCDTCIAALVVGALLRPRVSGVGVFRFWRPITVEEHYEHDDEHHGDGHHGHGEYPHELRHQFVVLQRRRLQWGPRRFGRRRFPRPIVDGVALDSRPPFRLVRDRGFPRRRLESYGSTQHPEPRRRLVGFPFERAVPAVVGFAYGAVPAVFGYACGAVSVVVGFAYGVIAASADGYRLPSGQSTGDEAAENGRPGGGRLAASGAVFAVRAHLVTDVRTAQAPAPEVAF